ncbi:MAG TPA: folylpolyglutamate synthase/dihydrofolate synthase family protein [Spirochaetota bacterium]|nr:folylpolyglutamate synthase/dihydrofolate synthase family protein [Spirochaetota bacterium]
MNKPARILEQFINNEKTGHTGFEKYSLSTMRKLVRRLGNPHRNIKTLHIAGTNGKGSTAFMISGIFEQAGYKTGLYISPHLEKVNERISINRRPITLQRLSFYLERILDESSAGGLNPTYFDALTAAAFNYFSDERVDLAVIETGLGGRLDSTNVVRPLVSVITDISLDHTAILGGDISSISMEKAGIIKYRVPVITSNNGGNALKTIESAAKMKKSFLYVNGRDYRVRSMNQSKGGRTFFSYSLGKRRIDNLFLGPTGSFQLRNAGLAITASLLLEHRGFAVGDVAIRKALAGLIIPGRLEIMSQKPLILFDPAHNPQAMRSLAEGLSVAYPDRKPVFILSFMKDKDVKSMFDIVQTTDPAQIIYYELDDDRCYTPLARGDDREPSQFHIIRGNDKSTRLATAMRLYMGGKYIVVATGSFRLYPVIKKLAISIAR